MLIALVALSIFLDSFPQIQSSSSIVAVGILSAIIEIYGFAKDRTPKDEAPSGSTANLTSSGPVGIQQQDVSVRGPQTNFADKVQGDVFSGQFDGPIAAAGGKAIDNRDATGTNIEPSGPINQNFVTQIIKPQEKPPVPQIQAPPQDFVGRVEELNEILRNFERGATITGLRGMGGVGKTALALVLAERLKGRFPDGQIFLDMQGTSPKPMATAEAMVLVIRAYLGAEARLPEDLNGLRGLYNSVLSGKRTLILLDNAASREQVEPLLPPAGSALLITSRNKFALAGLKEKDLDVLPLKDAKKLLLEIAGRIGNHADELAELCGCLPLALENAAYALKEKRNISAEDYLERLKDARKRLKLVDASFSLSYELLTPELQRLWSLLSVFPADFDLAGAAAVWEMEPAPAEEALGELMKWSLVDFLPTESGEGGRYRLHDLARVFAESRLEDAARGPARLRHAKYYQNVLWAANNLFLLGNDSLSIGLRLFDINWIGIQAGQKWASENKSMNNEIAKICSNFSEAGSILGLRLYPLENSNWLEAALASARQINDRTAEGDHLSNLGLAYFDRGESRKSIEYYEQALKISREIGDRQGEGNNLDNLGSAYFHLGESRRAIEYHELALKISRDIGDHRGEGNNLGNLGLAYSSLGELRKAVEYYDQALKIALDIGDLRNEGIYLGNLGNIYFHLGEPRKAIEYHVASPQDRMRYWRFEARRNPLG